MALSSSSRCSFAGARSLSHVRAVARPSRPQSRSAVSVKALFGGGGPGGMGGLMESIKKAQELVKVETEKVQKELQEAEFEGYDAEEMVRVVVSGNQVPVSIEVTEAAMKLSPEELSERLTKAAREAHASSVSAMQSKMKELAGKLGLPGLPGGGAAPGM